MSATLNLEIDPRLEFEDLKKCFEIAGIINISSDDSVIDAEFFASKMSVSARRCDDLPDLLLENFESPDRWRVGSRVIFYYQIATPELCNKEIATFLAQLFSASAAYFVLSFQYESAYALRDRDGLKFMEGFGVDLQN